MNKRITTLSIKGLNTSMPDLTVPDGACEQLTNMRFRDGSWQNVGVVQMAENIPLPEDVVYRGNHFEFLGVHEVEGVNHYIGKGVVESEDDAGYVYDDLYLFAYANGAWSRLGEAVVSIYASSTSAAEALATDIRVTPFGKVLIVQSQSKMSHFIWSDGSYNLFKMPEPVKISEDISSYNPRKSYDKEADKDLFWWNIINADSGENLLVDHIDSYWWGEICYLVAYRMKDGSIISPSNLRILCSEGNEEEDDSPRVHFREVVDGQETKKYVSLRLSATPIADPVTKDTYAESVRLRTFVPELTIAVPDIDTSLIDRVALYSTRINPILDYEKMRKTNFRGRAGIPYYDFYADNKLPEQPFYLVDETKIDSLEGGVWTVKLEYEKLKDLVTKPQMYEPVQAHSFVANSFYDYNHRMHYGGLTTTLYSHTPSVLRTHTIFSANILKGEEYIQFEDGHSVYSSSSFSNVDNQTDTRWVIPYIVSYPDYRATKLSVVYTRNNNTFGMESISLQPAVANNFAYYIPPTGVFKYTSFISPDNGYSPITKPIASPTFSEPNRIQVSAVDNIFSLPFENSYAVGNEGSRVVAMNSVADSLVDSNFYGAYPLYIFTTDGIFALRAGSGEVLYAGTEIINHDRLVNPNTIALNGSVVYACEEGLKALAGRQAVRISADIDTKDGVWLDWRVAQFGTNWRFGELLCHLGADTYMYNVGAGAWSSRNDVVGSLRGGYAGEVTQQGTLIVSDINKEGIDETEVNIVTRPLKFDSAGFKKIDTLIARTASSLPCDWSIKIESSNNCREWRLVKKVTTAMNLADIGIRRFSQSARFYRLSLSGTIQGIVPLTQIDMTIQDRYNNKLR